MSSRTPIKPPVGEAPGKKQAVAEMFNAIAHRYDLLNRVLSGGIDQHWRRRVVHELMPYRPRRILDVATGTGDLALLLAEHFPEAKIVGVDIAEAMLERGKEKVTEQGLEGRVRLQIGDSEKLPFPDRQFDAVTVAFGVRNFENLRKGIQEMKRVLKPRGHVVILEFSHPRAFPIRTLYWLYARHLLPRIGRWLSRNEAAYRYLPESVEVFPDGEDFLRILEEAGFRYTRWISLTGGIASIYIAEA